MNLKKHFKSSEKPLIWAAQIPWSAIFFATHTDDLDRNNMG